MLCELQKDGWVLRYEWEKKPVKNLNLRVRQDGSVYVSSARWVSQKVVEDFILSRRTLIESARQRLTEQRPPEEEALRDGTVLPCLGKPLRLLISTGQKEAAVLQGDTLLLTLRHPEDSKAIRRLFDRWWNDACQQLFSALINRWMPVFRESYSIPSPSLRLRSMSSRWGSCQPRTGIVTLNKRLLHAPQECIEYVVVHELAHFVHADHSPAFHAVVTKMLPDWKIRRKLLINSSIPR